MKKLLLILLFVTSIVSVCSYVYAQDKDMKEVSAPQQVELVHNEICPVMGSEIKPEFASYVEYNNKVYSLCCSGCVSAFIEDPQKYIDKINETE